jgi:uncharacterized protein YxjI
MNAALQRNLFLVKEQIGLLKAANHYDIYDPETNQLVLNCRENKLGLITKLLRFSDYKRMTPFHIELSTPLGEKVLTVKRGISIFRSRVEVLGAQDQLLGSFQQHFFSIGGQFDILDANNNLVANLKGKWTGWDFTISHQNITLAQVSKEWAGMGKELFTSADNYAIKIEENVASNDPIRQLILAAVMSIDMVLKE